MREAGPGQAERSRVRLDKWLWAARFYKTRVLAAEAIDTGQARLNGEHVRPAHAVREGDMISVRKHGLAWEVEVTGVCDRRGPAIEAAKLYREMEESRAARERLVEERRAAAESQPRWSGRPTKRQRRKLEDYMNEP